MFISIWGPHAHEQTKLYGIFFSLIDVYGFLESVYFSPFPSFFVNSVFHYCETPKRGLLSTDSIWNSWNVLTLKALAMQYAVFTVVSLL